METIKISVLMTVYNAENILAKSIEGILKQSYDKLEFIIVNDGSSDSSDQVIQGYLADPRIVYINRRENKGRRYSLKEGLQACTGEWVAVNDADDVSDPQRLQRVYEFIMQNGIRNRFGIVGSASRTKNLLDGTEESYHVKYGMPGKKRVSKARAMYSMPFIHSSFVYNREALLAVGGFAQEVTAWIDYFTMIKIANIRPVFALDECLVDRYIDGNNFFLKSKMINQKNKNGEIIEAWKKKNVRLYWWYHLQEIVIECIKGMKK